MIINIGRKNKGGKFMNIAIIGSGSWGVALAVHLASVGNNVKIWSFIYSKISFCLGVIFPSDILFPPNLL